MKFFCMDLHISIIADFKSVCPDVEVVDWCLSGHAWVMKRNQDFPEHINPVTWKNLNTDMITKFQNKYDSFLKTFDGFIVAFASSFAMIYEKYNKPILMMNAVRYDIPFCWTKDMGMLNKFHECLDRLNRKGLLTIISNNKGDLAYTQKGAGIPVEYIPSLCLYTNTRYTPTKSTFLCVNGLIPPHPLVTDKKHLPTPHEWSDITSFRGIINFPYEVSLMSCFEHFTAGCPLFFPSKTYWKANPHVQTMSAYWNTQVPSYLEEFKDLNRWIDLADMYDVFQSPNTHYFDSVEHLFQLLESFEYVDDRAFREAHIESVKQKWRLVLQKVISGKFWSQTPRHLSYNRLPLLANVVYDINYAGSGVSPQHSYPFREPLSKGDVVFVKTDYLEWFLTNRKIEVPITLVTGVSDISPTNEQCRKIRVNPNIKCWIGCNISASDPKIIKLPIGSGEPEREYGNHETLLRLHNQRIPWDQKKDDICIPYHSGTHESRTLHSTLPKLPFEDYMKAISQHKFVICMRGNGMDTHRFCEILLMGSVPVVEHSGLDDMYSQFPCLIVNSLNDIDTSPFQWDDSKYETFLDVFWLRDKLKYRLF
jgi:hypothetical protein